jgi:hypothetical protein
MFRIQFYTDDRYVTGIMRILAGKTHDLRIEPVINLRKTADGSLAPQVGGPRVVDLFAQYLAKHKIKEMRKPDISKFLESIGRAPGSATYLAGQAVQAHVLQRVGTGFNTTYQVVPKSIKSKAKPKAKPKAKTKTTETPKAE